MKKVVKKPTFFTQLVYDSIKEALEEQGDSIFSYSTKAWQLRLTRRLVTHSTDPQTGLSSLILSSQEEKMESADWEVIWSNMPQRSTDHASSCICVFVLVHLHIRHLFKIITYARHICKFDRNCICEFVYLCICIFVFARQTLGNMSSSQQFFICGVWHDPWMIYKPVEVI